MTIWAATIWLDNGLTYDVRVRAHNRAEASELVWAIAKRQAGSTEPSIYNLHPLAVSTLSDNHTSAGRLNHWIASLPANKRSVVGYIQATR